MEVTTLIVLAIESRVLARTNRVFKIVFVVLTEVTFKSILRNVVTENDLKAEAIASIECLTIHVFIPIGCTSHHPIFLEILSDCISLTGTMVVSEANAPTANDWNARMKIKTNETKNFFIK